MTAFLELLDSDGHTHFANPAQIIEIFQAKGDRYSMVHLVEGRLVHVDQPASEIALKLGKLAG